MSQTVALPPLPELPAGMPAQGQWTYEDYCRLPEDGKRYEVIRGVLYMSPSPRTRHQMSAGAIHAELRRFVRRRKLGVALVGPVDVILPGLATPLVPDVLLVVHERASIVQEKYVYGPPDLIVEVLSPSNPKHDRKTKFEVYAEAGVREYWIVDLNAHTIEVYTLAGKSYKLHGRFGRGQMATSLVLAGFETAVDEACEG